MKAFIIFGQTGEYSDRTEWAVRGYLNEERARQEVETLTARVGEVLVRFGDTPNWRYDPVEHDKVAKFVGDPDFQMDYTGTTYCIVEVDIADLGWPEAA